MWIYVPRSMSCPSAQAQEVLSLDSNWQSHMLAKSAWSRGKPLPAHSWSRGCKTKSWTRRLFGQMLAPSTAAHGVASWIASLADTHASHSAQWASENPRTTPDTSGQGSLESSSNASQDGSSSRTSQTTSTKDLIPSSLTYEDWVSMLKQQCLDRTRWGIRTIGGASSFWGTPRVGGGGGVGNVRKDTKSRLEDQLVKWDLENGISKQFESQILNTTGFQCSPQAQPKSPPGEKSSNKGQNTSRAINPNFAEWLMNWPPRWTATTTRLDKIKFDCWETESCRLVRAMLSAYCEKGYKEESKSRPREDMFGNPTIQESE